MTKIKRRNGRGVLNIIAGLLIASAFVRMGAQTGPAFATTPPEEQQETHVAEQPADVSGLLAALQKRESRLTEREAEFTARLQALRASEVEIDKKLAALVTAEQQLSATIAMADAASETDLGQLTTVFENMKPKEAAALFEEMPPQFAAGFLGLMRADAAASIMSLLQPETAYSFSVVLAGRNANVPTE